jgi:YjjG family noncanonical pyrimidine nucleotidase
MKIDHVFFDLDHTLWDFDKNSALAIETIFKKHSINVDLHEFLFHYVPINIKYWELYRVDKITQFELRLGRLKDTFQLLNYKIDDEKIIFLSEEYIEYLPKFNYLFDGAIEILDYLKPKYNLHIITNGFQEIQGNKLKNSKIQHYFDTVTNSEMAGVKKPNPLIFEYAVNEAKATKSKSIMIGDCIEADVKGALNFGMDAILFNYDTSKSYDNIKQVSHLLELKKYL